MTKKKITQKSKKCSLPITIHTEKKMTPVENADGL